VVVGAATVSAAKKAATATANGPSQAAPTLLASPVQEWPRNHKNH